MRKSAILVGIVTAIVGSHGDVWAQSYPFTCRGPLTVEFGQNQEPSLTMTFVQATKPATQGVEPGTCAWLDRAVRSNEPTCLQHSPRDVSFRVLSGPPPARPATAAETFRPDAAATARRDRKPMPDLSAVVKKEPPRFEIRSTNDAPYLESIATSAKTHIFQAHSKAGQTCLQVERLGP